MLFNVHKHILLSNPEETTIFSIDITNADHGKLIPYFSIGLHPWYANQYNFNLVVEKIKHFAKSENCLAIGECGLDKIKGPDLKTQLEVFEKQALLASELNKPLILHVVKSFDEILYFHKKIKPRQAWIIHGFRKDPQLARQLIQKGFLLSLGKAFLQQENLWQLIDDSLIHAILFESDEETSEIIRTIYQKAVELKKCSNIELEKIIQNNFERTFNRKFDGAEFVETKD